MSSSLINLYNFQKGIFFLSQFCPKYNSCGKKREEKEEGGRGEREREERRREGREGGRNKGTKEESFSTLLKLAKSSPSLHFQPII